MIPAERRIEEGDLLDAFEEIVLRRTSVRAYRPDPVPRATLERCLALAGRAPSNCNTQPWRTVLVSGDTRDRLAAAMLEDAAAERWSPDFPFDSAAYTPLYKQRQQTHGAKMFAAVGVAREDHEARRKITMRNMEFFGAPHAALLFMPRFGGVREAGDVGLFAQTLMLALAAEGVASCPQTAVGMFAEPVKRLLDIGDDLVFLYGIAIGYEDGDRVGSRIVQDRATLAESVTFLA